jgi:hypothetical protein
MTEIDFGGITIITFTDDGIAEIIIDPAATAEHVLDAMDLTRAMLEHGITAVRVLKSKPVTGEPAINIAHKGE